MVTRLILLTSVAGHAFYTKAFNGVLPEFIQLLMPRLYKTSAAQTGIM